MIKRNIVYIYIYILVIFFKFKFLFLNILSGSKNESKLLFRFRIAGYLSEFIV